MERIDIHTFLENTSEADLAEKIAFDKDSVYFYYFLPIEVKYGWCEMSKLCCQHNFIEANIEEIRRYGVKSNKWGRLLTDLYKLIGNAAPSQERIDNFVKSIMAAYALNVNTTFSKIEATEGYRLTSIVSCMSDIDDDGSDTGNHKLTELYNYLPEVTMLRQFDTQGVEVSRSLLWDQVYDTETGDIVKVCDRIYSTSDKYYLNHVKYCIDQGYVVRKEQSRFNANRFLTKFDFSQTTELNLEVKIKLTSEIKDAFWPYMDTFKYYRVSEDNTAIWSNDDDTDYKFTCTQTSGGNYYGKGLKACDHCGRLFTPSELITTFCEQDVCDDCRDNYFEFAVDTEAYHLRDELYYCITDRNYYYNDDNLVQIGEDWYLKSDDNIAECYHTGKYYFKSDLEYCVDIEEYVHPDYVYFCQTDDKYYYNNDDLVKIEYKWYLKSDDNIAECSNTNVVVGAA
jgi:hypothetical protein